MENDSQLYNSYTPLRNHLRKEKLIESLYAIHSHILHQQFNKMLPQDVSAPSGYRNAKTFRDFIQFYLEPWELELIAKEVILNSPHFGANKSLKEWHQMAGVVNKLKALEGKVSELYTSKDNVLIEVHRLAHRQFTWQRNPNTGDIAQYWKLYSYKGLSEIVNNEIGIPVNKLFLISMSLMGNYLNHFILWNPPQINVNNISPNDLATYLEHFSKDYEELQVKLKNELQINQKYPYAYHSLKGYPLIKMDIEGRQALICPVLTLFFRRITEGLYYEIYKAKDFDAHFGNSFQEYIGGMLNKSSSDNTYLLAEQLYGKPKKRTIDWIFGDKSALLFIECKAKRLTLEAKVNLTNTTELEKQLNILADGILQIYKNINEYKLGNYPHINYDSKKNIYPILVTLEDWFLFGDALVPKLNNTVEKKLTEVRLPKKMLQDYPFTVCSAEGLNMIATISKSFSLDKILHEKTSSSEKGLWHLDTDLKNRFSNEMASLITYGEDEFNEFIDLQILSSS
jgi:hypothetical protein